MAKYKLLVLLVLLSFVAKAQVYTPMTAWGYAMKRVKADSTLHIPSFCGVPTLRSSTAKDGAIAMDTCNNKLYKWTNAIGWSEITGGGGNQNLQSVLDNGNTSYNKDINLYGRSSGNQVYISAMDNYWMPFTALGDSLGGGIYQYTYPKATIEFIHKYMSQKLKSQDSTRSTIYLPTQNNDATDTLAKLSDIRAAYIDTSSMLTPYLRKVDTTAMLTPYLRKVDTTNKFVSNVTKLNDSTITIFKGSTQTNITLSPSTTVASATRLITQVYNNSGSTIAKGSVVYINGRHSSNLPTIALSQANTENNSYTTFAMVQDDITTSNSGVVIQAGNITNLNLPTSTYTDGEVVYLSPTVAGGITTTKPLAPNHIVKIGTITRAHPTFGTIELKIENGWQLDELSDVQIALTPNDSTILQFTRTDSLWKAVDPTTAMGNRFVKRTDSAAMLLPYLRKIDTTAMVLPYLRKIDTATLQNKSLAAYSFQANKTSVTANATANTFKDTSGTYTPGTTGTVTWSGTAPTSLSNGTFKYTQIGKMCTISITLLYASGGTNSNVDIVLPSFCATPDQPGFTSTNDFLYAGSGMMSVSTAGKTMTSTNPNANRACYIKKNASGHSMVITAATSGTVTFASGIVTYYTN
jgi:hypothetical protein